MCLLLVNEAVRKLSGIWMGWNNNDNRGTDFSRLARGGIDSRDGSFAVVRSRKGAAVSHRFLNELLVAQLFVMSPKAKHLYDVLFFEDLVYKAMLNIDPA